MQTLLEATVVEGSETSGEWVQLSVLDLLIGHLNMAGVFFFDRVPNVQKMKTALSAALDIYPSFGGSLVERENKYYLHQNNIGVGFSVMENTDRSTDAHYLGPIREGSPLIDKDAPFEYVLGSNRPITSFRLTLFADNHCALTIRFIHSQADGAGVSRFMQAWSELYRRDKAAFEPPEKSYYRRDVIARLARGDGQMPSAKFDRRPTANLSIADRIEVDAADFAIRYVDIDTRALNLLVAHCRAVSGIPLSSSDIVHAMAWQTFARSAVLDAEAVSRLHTIFDIRAVAALQIPANFEGNALFERSAAANFATLRKLSLAELAVLYHRQVKPLDADDIRRDIAFLEQEYAQGHIDSNGRFTRFVRGSMVDCQSASALFVNDMRFLKSAEVAFEDRTQRYETAISLGRNFVFVYSRGAFTTFLYTGHRTTTENFAHELQRLAESASRLSMPTPISNTRPATLQL